MNPQQLKAFLIGCWQLRSYTLFDVEQGTERQPLGGFPLGRLIYSHDGHMSVQIMQADDRRAHPLVAGSAGIVAGLLAYAGSFETRPEAIVSHFPHVGNYLPWLGGELSRKVCRQSPDEMELVTTEPLNEAGTSYIGRIRWLRASALASLAR